MKSPRSSYYFVLVAAVAVIVVAVIWAFFLEKRITFDDFGLFNPAYMTWKYGVPSYPTYGEFYSMVEEPPTNFLLIGGLMRAGLTSYFAEALGPFLLVLLSVTAIVRTGFSTEVKASLLFGLLAGSLLPWISIFGGFGPGMAATRPDLAMSFAWFAGLVVLESGRLANWEPKRLCLGGALLMLATSLHYIAIFGWTGALVYAAWAMRAKGKGGFRAAISIILGLLLVAIPLALLWFIPDFLQILTYVGTGTNQPFGNVLTSLSTHIQLYHEMYAWFNNPFVEFLFLPLAVGLPVVVLSTPVLLLRHETRGMAIASLPYMLFLLLFVQRKSEQGYYFPELIVYASAACLFLILAGNHAARIVASRLRNGHTRARFVTPLIATLLLISMISVPLSSNLPGSTSLVRPDEMSIARAAGKEMLGPHALVGAQIGRSYVYGEAYWYNIDPDVLWNPVGNLNLTAYFSNFDAIGADTFESYAASNGLNKSLPSWYVDGTLNLHGFYFSTLHTVPLDYILLSVKQPKQVIGFGTLGNWTVLQFEQTTHGNYTYVAAVCGQGDSLAGLATLFSNTYLLPQHAGSAPQKLVTFVSRASDYSSYRWKLASECDVRQEMSMQAQDMPYGKLLSVLQDDRPIMFFPSLLGAVTARRENMTTFSSAPPNGVFSDNFGTDSVGQLPAGWLVHSESGSHLAVTDCQIYGAGRCVLFSGGNGSGYSQLSPQLEGVDATSLSFEILASQTDKPLNIYGYTPIGSGIGIEVTLLSNGAIAYYDGSAFRPVSSYKTGEWYNITMTDFNSDSYDLYVNSTLVSQGAKMRTPGPIQNLEFQTYPTVSGGSWYISSVKVTYTTPGAAIGEGPPAESWLLSIILESAVILLGIKFVGRNSGIGFSASNWLRRRKDGKES